jgi:hypothetical protein
MSTTVQQRRPMGETARLGEEIYARLIKTVFGQSDHHKYGAIAVDSGSYEVDADAHIAITRLKNREPGADVWLVKIGERGAARFGSCR